MDDHHEDTNTEFDDLAYLASKLKQSLVWKRNETLSRQVLLEILPRWKDEFADTSVWKKIRKRIIKELNEVEPCITFVQKILLERTQPVMIVDLCSGFGILPMLLSEILPQDKVNRIYLIDKSFPMDVSNVQSHHITVDHLVQKTWRIPLRFRKVDLKTPRQKRQLHRYIFPNESIIFTGIHLCKALSVHAINLYHEHQALTQASIALCLKPCCLPGKRNLFADKQPICYQFSSYSFCPLVLYPFMDNRKQRGGSTKEPVDDHGNDQQEQPQEDDTDTESDHNDTASCDDDPTEEDSNISCCGPHAHFGRGKTTNRRFSQWVEHLRRGCETDDCTVQLINVAIQSHHFQNQYICSQQTTNTTGTTGNGT